MPSATSDRRRGLTGDKGVKAPVALATTGPITIFGEQVVDGTLTAASRVMVWKQADPTENGLYDTSDGPWTRCIDANGNQDFALGTLVTVASGASGRGTYEVRSADPIVIDASAIQFEPSVATGDLATQLANTVNPAYGPGLLGFNATLNYVVNTLGWAALQDGINANWLGARGDGTTDSTAAILAAMALSPTGTVRLGEGTYLIGQLVVPVGCSIRGAGLSSTTLKLKNGTNPTGGVLDTPNFAALTGTTSLGGWFNNQISDLTIDGNKANNTSGYGLRIYGKSFRLRNVRVQNCAEIGIYTEYRGGDDFTTPLKNLEAELSNVSSLLCGGDGLVLKGPHDMIVTNLISYSHGGWALNVLTSINAHHINTYTSALGGIWVHTSGAFAGAINGSGVVGSSGAGWGALLESGGNNLAASSFGGPIALEIRANNNIIQGIVANSTIAGVKLNGASANARFDLTMFNNSGFWLQVAAAGGKSFATIYGDDAIGTLQDGAFPGHLIVSGAKSTIQLDGGLRIMGGRLLPPKTDATSQSTCGIFFDTSPPASGAFNRGDRVINSLPAVGQPKGWACTVSGTPGTWVSEGNL